MMRHTHRIVAAAPIAVLWLYGCSERNAATAEPFPSALVVDDSLGSLTGDPALSNDGMRIAYSRTVQGRSNIFVANADGSNPVQLTRGVWDSAPVWSNDSRFVAYAAEDPDFDVFVVASDGSVPPRRLAAHPGRDFAVVWLPGDTALLISRQADGDEHPLIVPLDGRQGRRILPPMGGNVHGVLAMNGEQFLFDLHRNGGASVWIQDSISSKTSKPRQLTTENLENLPPRAWSPDSTEILYISRRTGTSDVWVKNLRTGAERQLTDDIRNDGSPQWSPDGRWVAFTSDRGGQNDIWIVPSSGGNATRVTNDQAIEANLRWSPDGRSIVYAVSTTDVELQLLPATGGAPRTLVKWTGFDISNTTPSPDGSTILFSSDRSGDRDLWSVSTAGGVPKPFLAGPLADSDPRYSPDGKQVLFSSTRGTELDLWIVPATGGEPRNLTNAPGNETNARWSPDGTKVAFISDHGGSGLWVIPAAGGEATRLVQSDRRPASAAWSPDGQYLYFLGSRPSGGNELYRIAANGGPVKSFGAHEHVNNFDVSPDGKQIAYSTFVGGWAYVDVIPAEGGAPRRLTKDTANVYHPRALWYPNEPRLLVHNLDLAGNRDATDLMTVNINDGTWSTLTQTRMAAEISTGFMPGGKEILVESRTLRTQIRRVTFGDKLIVPPKP